MLRGVFVAQGEGTLHEPDDDLIDRHVLRAKCHSVRHWTHCRAMMAFRAVSKGITQYTKMTAVAGCLVVSRVGGGDRGAFRHGCQLLPLDYHGKKLDRPAIDLDMQAEWLFADSDRLWAVSKNEVAEVLADGTRPEVMRPTRFLLHPSRPFLYEEN